MSDRRLLVIGLDAFDSGVAETLMREGRMPALAALEKDALRFDLDHGIEKYSGLAWEQFSTGLSPQSVDRWSACNFDGERYAIDQPTTRLPPFALALDRSTVVFDTPYFDLASAPQIRGMVSWGSHDPGVPVHSSPAGLAAEIAERFGPYPAEKYIYGHVWPDRDRTADMSRAIVEAVDRRSDVTEWLFRDRLPEWDLAITVLSEFHSATEALWHGWDESHPLHRLPSAAPARDGLIGVYEAADRMIGRLCAAFPDVRILAFSAHGMARNISDTTAMILIPELLYRHYIGEPGLRVPAEWRLDGSTDDSCADIDDWGMAIKKHLQIRSRRRGLAGAVDAWHDIRKPLPHYAGGSVDWMPATSYRTAWPSMKAFAVPAYYDARIRINLKGREARGMVRRSDYESVLDDVEALIRACRDPRTGVPIDVGFERRPGDPFGRHVCDADLIVRFAHDHYALDHPRFGRVGPVPCRRTGGHSGGLGVGYLTGHRGSRRIGRFPTLEVSALVRALMGDAKAEGSLVDAVRDNEGG
jgi:predicted AlkP superfamily phosphohydrolase/phosphomutase